MKIFRSLEELHIEEDTVCAIGKFDGAHRGHRLIMSRMRQLKEERGLKMAAFSFSLMKDTIDDEQGRLEKFEQEGFDYLALIPFQSAADIEGDAFIRDILVGRMHMRAIVAGTDCTFGHNRSGDAALLRRYADAYGYEVYILDKLRSAKGDEISSTSIRQILAEGDVESAARLLGEYYTIHDIVRPGNHVGTSRLDNPTANIYPQEHMLLPKSGVYATYVRIEGNPRVYAGMTNIGGNPTVKDDPMHHRCRVETYILDLPFEELYGRAITVYFVKYLRPEKRFASLDELREQLMKDRESVRAILPENGAGGLISRQ